MLFGAPRDVHDPDVFHSISLVALLAWVGLGADGLSSSAYGPDEAFRALGDHRGLAFFLALATALTVAIISTGYSRIIARFPSGGGGYVVAHKFRRGHAARGHRRPGHGGVARSGRDAGRVRAGVLARRRHLHALGVAGMTV
jgi:hypothetical protein